MIASSDSKKHYASAHKRLLHASISGYLERVMPRYFGPELRDKVVNDLIALLEIQMPSRECLQAGQCLWNAVSIETRADSPKLKLVPVILTLVSDDDIERLASGESVTLVAQDIVARMLNEAYEQGGLLSMRDIGLLTQRRGGAVSKWRTSWEIRHKKVLPHTGSLQDFGSCITHKTSIVKKAVYEKKDTLKVSQETKHTQQSVDRYLKDFYRVRTCYQHNADIEFIHQVTGMSIHLVKQYIELIEKHECVDSSFKESTF